MHVRRLGAVVVAGGWALTVAKPHKAALAQKSPPTEAIAEGTQWLWTVEGVQVRRNAAGEVRFVYESTGKETATRPAEVPKEAYANRWRFPPWQGWDAVHPDLTERDASRRGGSRHVLLVRHAQYNMEFPEDERRTLTELGRRQCEFLAAKLAAVDAAKEGFYEAFALASLSSSRLTRAVQTADVLAAALPGATRTPPDATLNEGRPCLPEPAPRPHRAASYTNKNHDGERIEQAYRLICARPPAGQVADTHEVVVCHANVIRYVVCRALQLPPEAWLRMSLPHASVTHLVVRPNGHCSLRCLGDAGHLPPEMVSY